MPHQVWTAEHEHEHELEHEHENEHEHEHEHDHEHLHRLLHQGDGVLVQKWPARLAEGIAARAARQARARQTEGWP